MEDPMNIEQNPENFDSITFELGKLNQEEKFQKLDEFVVNKDNPDNELQVRMQQLGIAKVK